MSTFWVAVALRPLFYAALFFLVLAPIIWVLNKVIPPGRVKTFLFKVRDGKLATTRDKVTMWVAVIGAYVLLFGSIALFY